MYSIEKKDGVLEVNIKFPVNYLMDYCYKVYEKNEADYEVEGYKKGEAPMEEVLNKYGEEILDKAQSTALNEVISSVLKENPEISILGVSDLQLVSSDENYQSFKVISKYVGIKLGQYKGFEINCESYFDKKTMIRLEVTYLLDRVIKSSTFKFLPNDYIEKEKNYFVKYEEAEIIKRGLTMDSVLKAEDLTMESYEKKIYDNVLHDFCLNLVIHKICEIESLVATPAEIDEKIMEKAHNENTTFDDVKKSIGDMANIFFKQTIESDKVYDFLVNNNTFIFNKE